MYLWGDITKYIGRYQGGVYREICACVSHPGSSARCNSTRPPVQLRTKDVQAGANIDSPAFRRSRFRTQLTADGILMTMACALGWSHSCPSMDTRARARPNQATGGYLSAGRFFDDSVLRSSVLPIQLHTVPGTHQFGQPGSCPRDWRHMHEPDPVLRYS